MTKIIVLSEYGFKLATNPDKWISCDKRFINSKAFKDLKVGDDVVNMQYNDKQFITDITVLKHEVKGEGSHLTSLKSSPNNSLSSSLPVSHSLGRAILERDEGGS